MGINVNGAQNSNLPLPEQTKKKEEGQKAENSIFTKYDNNKDGTISASADNTAARYVKTQGKAMFSAQCGHAAQVGGSFNDIASTLLKSINFSFSPATLNEGESKTQIQQQLNSSCETEIQTKIQEFINSAAEAYTNAINNNHDNNINIGRGNTNSNYENNGNVKIIGFDGKERGSSTNKSNKNTVSTNNNSYSVGGYNSNSLNHVQAGIVGEGNWAKSETTNIIEDGHATGVSNEITSLAADVESVSKENYDSVKAQLETTLNNYNNTLLELNKKATYNEQQQELLSGEITNTDEQYSKAFLNQDRAELELSTKSTALSESIRHRDEVDIELSKINSEYDKLCEDVRAKEEIKSEKQVKLSSAKENTGKAEGKLEGLQSQQQAAQKILDGINKEENPEEYNNALNKLNELNTNIQKAEQELESAKKEEENAKIELEKAEEELSSANQAKEEKLNSLKEKDTEHKELIEECISSQKEVETCQTDFDIKKEQVDNLNRQKTELKEKLNNINNLDYKYDIDRTEEQIRNLNILKVRLAEKRDGFDA